MNCTISSTDFVLSISYALVTNSNRNSSNKIPLIKNDFVLLILQLYCSTNLLLLYYYSFCI